VSARPSILITYPHSMGAGGGGTIGCIQIAKHLVAAGAAVTIATVTTISVERSIFGKSEKLPPERYGDKEENDLRAAGVDIVRIPPHPLHYYLDGLPTARCVKRLIAERDFDACLGWHQEYAQLPRLLQRRGIVTGLFTSGWYRDFKNVWKILPHLKGAVHTWMQRRLLLTSLRQADVVFAISEFTKGEVHDSFKTPLEKFQVAHWGVSPVFDNPDRKPRSVISRFVFFGSPDRRKGGFESMQAFAELSKRGYPNWEYKVIWPYREELEQMARELGVTDQVIIVDPLDQAGLARELDWADVAIIPSKFESFGLACAEAETNGIPVICYDVGGVSEVVLDRETGWLVPNARPDLLPDAILEAMRDPERTYAMGMAGREHINTNYSWERTAETILGRLESLIPSKTRPES